VAYVKPDTVDLATLDATWIAIPEVISIAETWAIVTDIATWATTPPVLTPPWCGGSALVMVSWVGQTCFSDWLIAYAPYNTFNDYTMYTAWLPVSFTKANLNHASNECTSEGGFKNLWGSICTKLWAASNFYSINGSHTWISLDNVSVADYLKYTLPQNLIDSSFSIEMSVRGAALKRSTRWTVYSLFQIWNIYLNLSSSNDWTLSLWYISWDNSRNVKSISNIHENPTIDNDNFYKVRASFNWTDWNLNIFNEQWDNILTWRSSDISWINPVSSELYVWGSVYWISYSNQWNDVIDYIKIYNLNPGR
jgi:hypothetical protein